MKHVRLTSVNSWAVIFSLLAAIVTLVAFSGCGQQGRPDRASVSGTVKYKGRALPGAIVRFVLKSDPVQSAGSSIGADGSFLVQDAPIGATNVIVDTKAMGEFGPKAYVEIPEKYSDPERSGLKYEVKAGENKDAKFDIE